jgi:hypothetical protein
MPTSKNSLVLHGTSTVSSAGAVIVPMITVPTDELWCVQRHSYQLSLSLTGSDPNVRVIVTGHGYNHPIGETASPTANRLYTDPEPIWLTPGETMCLWLRDAQANTVVDLFVIGYRVKLASDLAYS